MTEITKKMFSDIQNLSSTLLSTLDESIFFIELSGFLAKYIKANKVQVYSVSYRILIFIFEATDNDADEDLAQERLNPPPAY